jgi:GNAT superfamily N-acetyltransferase
VSSPKTTIRVAVIAERERLEALQWRASLSNPGDREALLASPDAIELPVAQVEDGLVFVAEVGSEVAGFAAIAPRADGDVELDGLFVEPHTWRRGIGRALVEHCCAAAQRRGARSLHVVGHPQAEGFYRACGFELHGTVQTRFGPGLAMQRALTHHR